MTGIQWPPVPPVFSQLKINKSLQMTQRKFSMKKMALKSNFGFTTVNHYYTEDERQVGRQQTITVSVCRLATFHAQAHKTSAELRSTS